jgi:RNA polymerase sigma factor (sigma-70 family)
MRADLEQKAFISLAGLETENLWTNEIALRGLCQRHTDFWHLWKQYQDYFYRRCLNWMGGNSYDAEDLLSRAMLKAWNQWLDYAGKIVNPKAWLSRLIHNLSVDIHRERQRETQITDEALVTPCVESPESEILRHELGAYLRYIIESLPPRLRDPFILHYCQHKSYREIAKQLALSEDNVWKRVKQAQTILQKQLNNYVAGKDDTCLDSLPPHLKSLIPTVEEFKTDQTVISDGKVSITTGNVVEQINYQITVTCLETLPHNWYSSPSPLGWS